MKLAMTIDEALEFADEWSKGLTLYEGAQGWRVVCMLLAEEVRKQRDAFPVAHRLALELECLLLSCTDTALAEAEAWASEQLAKVRQEIAERKRCMPSNAGNERTAD